MSWSDVTASPDFEDVRRTATLEALARNEFAPGSARDEESAEFADDSPVIFQVATAHLDADVDRSVDDPATTMATRIIATPQFATAWVAGSVDSSTDDPTSRLVGRIAAATQHEEITAVLPLMGLRMIADRLDYLHEISDDDPDEPRMVLASLRELALFFVSEPLFVGDRQRGEPEIGISPGGILQAEWPVRDGGILAMKFRPDGLIQFAAVSRPIGGQHALRVHGTLPKDRALDAVRPFIGRGVI